LVARDGKGKGVAIYISVLFLSSIPRFSLPRHGIFFFSFSEFRAVPPPARVSSCTPAEPTTQTSPRHRTPSTPRTKSPSSLAPPAPSTPLRSSTLRPTTTTPSDRNESRRESYLISQETFTPQETTLPDLPETFRTELPLNRLSPNPLSLMMGDRPERLSPAIRYSTTAKLWYIPLVTSVPNVGLSLSSPPPIDHRSSPRP